MGSISAALSAQRQSGRRARREFRQSEALQAQQAERDKRAEQALQGQIGLFQGQIGRVGNNALLRQRAGLEGLEQRFGQARAGITDEFTRRGLQGQLGKALGGSFVQQAAAESQLLRDIALQDEVTRQSLIQQRGGVAAQIAQLLGQASGAAQGQFGLTQLAAQQQQAAQQFLTGSVGNAVDLTGALLGVGGVSTLGA